MWISGKQIGNAWRQTRGFLKSTYHEGKKWANMIDGYAPLFKKGLNAAAPMLQDLGAGEALVVESRLYSHMVRFESR